MRSQKKKKYLPKEASSPTNTKTTQEFCNTRTPKIHSGSRVKFFLNFFPGLLLSLSLSLFPYTYYIDIMNIFSKLKAKKKINSYSIKCHEKRKVRVSHIRHFFYFWYQMTAAGKWTTMKFIYIIKSYLPKNFLTLLGKRKE